MRERSIINYNLVDLLRPYKQKYSYSCGPASLVMTLACYGIKFREEEIVKYMNTSEGGGTHWFEMISFIYDTDFRPTLLFRSNFPKLKDIFDTNHLPIIVEIGRAS